MLKKTPVVRGKPVVMRTRDDEEQLVLDWLNLQSKYSDSIRFLIQKEIAENGLRNLQGFIPQSRSIESLRNQLSTMPVVLPTVHNAPEQLESPLVSLSVAEQMEKMNPVSDTLLVNEMATSRDSSISTALTKEQENTQNQGTAVKRPAGKKFSSDVASSFAN